MKTYTSDEIGYEITEYDIPDLLAATPPEGVSQEAQDAHLVGAVEGYIAGYTFAKAEADWNDPAWQLDQPGLARRDIGDGFTEWRGTQGGGAGATDGE